MGLGGIKGCPRMGEELFFSEEKTGRVWWHGGHVLRRGSPKPREIEKKVGDQKKKK